MSVHASQDQLDLKVGVAFTRLQVRLFQGNWWDLDCGVLGFGLMCPTPTLAFCVQRHIDIETFKPEPYLVLELNVLKHEPTMRAV